VDRKWRREVRKKRSNEVKVIAEVKWNGKEKNEMTNQCRGIVHNS